LDVLLFLLIFSHASCCYCRSRCCQWRTAGVQQEAEAIDHDHGAITYTAPSLAGDGQVDDDKEDEPIQFYPANNSSSSSLRGRRLVTCVLASVVVSAFVAAVQ